MSLDELFDGVSKKLKIDFEEQAKILGHPGEVGSGRENVLKSILTKYIPKRFSVDSGFVIDALGNRSQQIDIVIYEANYTPVFEIVEGKKFFPCETVVAVGQVKTDIGSAQKMQECLGNIGSVKSLDRSNQGTNRLITGPGISLSGMSFDPNKEFKDQIFGFIFCSSSMKPDSMIAELQEFNRKNERKLWTNAIVNYNEYLIEYEGKGHLTQNVLEAEKIIVTDAKLTSRILPLFISILNNFLNMAHVARPNLFAYCKIDAVEHHDYELMVTGER
ncbi:hypothetical protein MUP01_06415 [Candidatus Bathyarchaeota archaeon]|nr:hypothetical protein [Candidatus Bathyarchaeota archaeon]